MRLIVSNISWVISRGSIKEEGLLEEMHEQ